MKLSRIVWIGLGGFIGSVLRYVLTVFIQSVSHNTFFPMGTFIVNMIGCFFIGFFFRLFEVAVVGPPELRLFIFVGLLGSFTTFSTFSNDTVLLFDSGRTVTAGLYILNHTVVGLLGVVTGRYIGALSVRAFEFLMAR